MVTKKDLIEKLANGVCQSLPAVKTEAIVNELFNTIIQSLVEGEDVRIHNFGTFKVVTRAARNGVNPHTGDKLQIPEKKSVSLRASSNLKKAVN
jgi:nucleoid DNA-binding protein